MTEQGQYPGHPRVSVQRDTGIGQIVTRQWPVIAVNAVQVSPARAFPPQWHAVGQSDARIRTPVLMPASGSPVSGPSGGNMIDLKPGALGGAGMLTRRAYGRESVLVSTSYTSGYPHAGIAASAEAEATSLAVDDVTGWEGWTGFILDGPSTELATVTAATATTPVQLPGVAGTVQAGPGTLTLASPLGYAHEPGALITAIPLAALHAAALSAAVIALETITAIAAQSSSGQIPGGLGALAFESEKALEPFQRIA